MGRPTRKRVSEAGASWHCRCGSRCRPRSSPPSLSPSLLLPSPPRPPPPSPCHCELPLLLVFWTCPTLMLEPLAPLPKGMRDSVYQLVAMAVEHVPGLYSISQLQQELPAALTSHLEVRKGFSSQGAEPPAGQQERDFSESPS